jgi:hypothetical protein
MPQPTGALEAASGSAKTAETLSQFVARVLDQLSLSAWLPSAALVLTAATVLQLGATLDADPSPTGAGAAVGQALGSIAAVSLGGAVVLVVAIVVLTILTQAFAFEAIRVLEGYWGTLRPTEALADRRARKFEDARAALSERQADLTRRAWRSAREAIETAQSQAAARGDTDSDFCTWTPDMLAYLGSKLLGQATLVQVTPDQRIRALAIPWERFAPPDLLRRQVNVDKRLRDYPRPGRALPTKLGNVLRAHEDQTARDRVETFVLELYDTLPATLQRQHDEHRNRLDLYCSMVFVLLFVAAVAVGRLAGQHPGWAAGCAGLLFAGIWLSYRAAVASARVYGLLIVEIARRHSTAV